MHAFIVCVTKTIFFKKKPQKINTVPIACFADLPVEKLSIEVLNATDGVPGLGGQLLCRDGVLYMTVPLRVFGWVTYEPSLDIFEVSRPGDACSEANAYMSPHCK